MAKVNVDENPGLADRYSIRSIPTMLFVKGGRSSSGSSAPPQRPCCRTSSMREPE